MAFQDLLFSVFVFSHFWVYSWGCQAQTAWLKAIAVCLSQFYRESEIKVLTGLSFPEGLREGSIYPCYFPILKAFIGLGKGPLCLC